MLNPYKKLSKINPQREQGNRQIVNDVYKALIKAKLNGAEYKSILFIIDKSWGFGKNSDGIAYSQMIKASNLSRPAIINTVKKLEFKRVLVVNRKVVKGSLPVNEYLFNKHYDTWLDKTGKVMFTSLEIEQIRKAVKLVKGSLPDKKQTSKKTEQTGKQLKQKLVKQRLPTKETITKETITKERNMIMSQIKNFLSYFPQNIQDIIKEYVELARLENKTKQITLQKECRLINELHLVWSTCEEEPILQEDFEAALKTTVNNQVSNVNYLRKVMRGRIRRRKIKVKQGYKTDGRNQQSTNKWRLLKQAKAELEKSSSEEKILKWLGILPPETHRNLASYLNRIYPLGHSYDKAKIKYQKEE